MTEERYTLRCTVYVLFIKTNKILLYRRANTDWQNGKYNIPGGHLDPNERALEAAIREAKEETDLNVNESDLELVHVLHRLYKPGVSKETNTDIVDLFFKAKKWTGKEKIAEEDKSDDMIWADIDNLPDNTLEFEKHAIDQINRNNIYSEFSG